MSNNVLDLTADQAEWFAEVAGATAYRVRRRWHQWVELEDLTSEAWLWLCAHPEVAQQLFGTEDGEKQLSRLVFGVLEVYARTEKASRSGYEPEDEFFYSVKMLREILPEVFRSEEWATPAGPEVHGRTSNPAEGGGWMSTLADVRGAVVGMARPRDRRVLELRFKEGLLLADIGQALGTTEKGAEMAVNFALGRLMRFLGGGRPFMDNRYVGTRRVISNASAQARTRSGYED